VVLLSTLSRIRDNVDYAEENVIPKAMSFSCL
jgi:hypothetical protein